MVQKKSTPCRKPTNSGGSPSGDSAPPILATRMMKNTTTCTLWSRAGIGAQQRPHQDHRRAGGADDARDGRAEGEDRGVDERRAAQRSGDENSARDHVEREQQDDEAHVFADDRVRQRGERGRQVVERGNRHDGERAPHERDLAVMGVPEFRRQQRAGRDRDQEPGERQRPRPRQLRAVEAGRARRTRKADEQDGGDHSFEERARRGRSETIDLHRQPSNDTPSQPARRTRRFQSRQKPTYPGNTPTELLCNARQVKA